MIFSLLLFAAGLVLLLKGADMTVAGARGLASRFKVSPTFIGLTVIAFGTSLPELVVTTEAFQAGSFDLGMGNIIGSNIANIALVLGLYAFLQPGGEGMHTPRQKFLVHTFLMLCATAVFLLLSFRGVYDILSGIIMLALFGGTILLLWRSGNIVDDPEHAHSRYPFFFTLAGLAAVIIGAHLLITGAVEIAIIFAIPPVVIGLSMVAVGTSLPELATSIVAAYKNSPGIAVGNILGSNIFNLLLVLGLNALFVPIPSPDFRTISLLALFTAAILPLFARSRTVTKIWGALLVCGYLVYILSLYWVF